MARTVHLVRHAPLDVAAGQENKTMSLIPTADYFRGNIAFRNDTLLGVCEALGHDLEINPNFLRVPLAAGIIFAPLMMVGIYFGLGVLVFASRALLPNPAVPVAADQPLNAEVAAANHDVELPRAA